MSLPVLDAASGGVLGSIASSLTWAHTVNNPSALNSVYLYVWVMAESNGTISGVTYNAVSMTQLALKNDSVNQINTYLFRLQNPANGNHNVVATASASVPIAGGSSSWTNVATSSAEGTIATATGTTSTTSNTVTSNSTNQMLLEGVATFDGDTLTATAGQTIDNQSNNSGFAGMVIAHKASSGSNATLTMSGVTGANDSWTDISFALNGFVSDALAASPPSLSVGGSSNNTVQITNNGGATDNITTSIVGASSWLSVSPTTFNGLGAGNSTNFKISVNQAFLVPGTYTDSVKFTSSNGATVTVPVTMVIPAIVGSIAWSGGSGAQTVNQGLGIIIGTG